MLGALAPLPHSARHTVPTNLLDRNASTMLTGVLHSSYPGAARDSLSFTGCPSIHSLCNAPLRHVKIGQADEHQPRDGSWSRTRIANKPLRDVVCHVVSGVSISGFMFF